MFYILKIKASGHINNKIIVPPSNDSNLSQGRTDTSKTKSVSLLEPAQTTIPTTTYIEHIDKLRMNYCLIPV